VDLQAAKKSLDEMDKTLSEISTVSMEPEELPRLVEKMKAALDAGFNVLAELVDAVEDADTRLKEPVSR
jgi:hypothetical protein